jgi:hypothetical protein
MGIEKFRGIATNMMRKNSSNYEHVDGEEGPDILAMDLNCIVYWSIDEIHDPEKSETLTCNTEEFEKLIVVKTLETINEIVGAIKPKVLILALDGVPPLAKIMNQRVRRLESSSKIIVNSSNDVIFSPAWIAPNSSLIQSLDVELKGNLPEADLVVYSGPNTPGEGEHKIFPTINYICHDEAMKRKFNVKKIYVFGNDNDLFLLSALFLANFNKSAPEVCLYDDFSTKNAEGKRVFKEAGDIKFSNINQFLVSVTNDKDEYSAPGKNRLEKMLTFIALSCLLGNDFIPRIGLTIINGANVVQNLFKMILKSARDAKGSLIADINENFPIKAKEDTMPYIIIPTDKANMLVAMINLAEKISTLPGTDVSYDDERARLVQLSTGNGVATYDSNSIALAASVDYFRMIDNVLSYYASSCCVIPATLTSTAKFTMPHEYYGYYFPPPTVNYLCAGLQILVVIETDGLEKYPRSVSALVNFSMANIDYKGELEKEQFLHPDLHGALIFPRCLAEKSAKKVPMSCLDIPEKYDPFFPLKIADGVNPSIFPGQYLAEFINYRGSGLKGIVDELVVTERKTTVKEDIGNYVPDALAN